MYRWLTNTWKDAPHHPLLEKCKSKPRDITSHQWSESVKLLRLFAIPWTVAYQPPLFMEFFRQEYWSGLPFPSPWELPDPGIKPRSPTLQADTLPSEPPEKLLVRMVIIKKSMFRKNSMYIIYSETDHQPRWDAWDKCSGLVHWEDPEESGGEGGGRGDRDGEYM